jgi:hypothetical protein
MMVMMVMMMIMKVVVWVMTLIDDNDDNNDDGSGDDDGDDGVDGNDDGNGDDADDAHYDVFCCFQYKRRDDNEDRDMLLIASMEDTLFFICSSKHRVFCLFSISIDF